MTDPSPSSASRSFRTIWISDVHLGMKLVRTDALLDFLRHHEAETIYIVGDLIDGWLLKRSWSWTQQCNDVVQKLLRKVRKGAQIYYIPGNHDEFARDYAGLQLGGIKILRQATHTTIDNRSLLVLHGDEFDGVIACAKWLSMLGAGAYSVAMRLNQVINVVRRAFGHPYWSLSAYLKNKVKDAVKSLARFEQAVVEEARRHQVDGVICGHIHRPAIEEFEGITYYNTGDWVESCTALVEHFDGSMEIIHWPYDGRRGMRTQPVSLPAESQPPVRPAPNRAPAS